MQETTKLVSPVLKPWRSIKAILESSSASSAGFHANSEWLSCPERARLKALKIVKRPDYGAESDGELDALGFGTLIHEILAYRVQHGHEAALMELDFWRRETGEKTYALAALVLGTYELTFPEASEPLTVLGVETEVVTNISRQAAPIYRTVRYDGVVLAQTPGGAQEVYSLERKTMSRGGHSALWAYYPQGMAQVGLWNANKALVATYGEMKGVIYESIIKTKAPSVDRQAVYFSKRQQQMALDYLRYAEDGTVRYTANPDGTYPKMLHACWGRFAPCPYVSACHDDIWGDYQHEDGTPLTGAV